MSAAISQNERGRGCTIEPNIAVLLVNFNRCFQRRNGRVAMPIRQVKAVASRHRHIVVNPKIAIGRRGSTRKNNGWLRLVFDGRFGFHEFWSIIENNVDALKNLIRLGL